MSKQRPNKPQLPTPQPSATITSVQLHASQFSGPIPSPELLARYNQVLPGSADRIITMAERDSLHIQNMEYTKLTAEYSERRLGQFLGMAIGVCGLTASVACAWLGQPVPASVIGGATLVSLVSVFVAGRIVKTRSKAPE